MSKMVQRVAALVVMLALVLGITYWQGAASSVSYQPLKGDAPIVMTVNGSEVNAEEFSTYMLYNMRYYENMYAQYGLTDIWSDEGMGEMMGSMMPSAAKDQAVYARVVLEQFEKAGLKLSDSKQKEMTTAIESTIERSGGKDAYLNNIAQLGFNEQTYTNFMYITQCYSALDEYYFGENGVNKPSEEEMKNYFRDNYYAAKHILIGTVDPMTGETKRTDAEALAEAQSILGRIKAGEDFDTLMKEKSEDGGLESNPNGYVFTEGDMVAPFYEGTKALAEGGISEPVKSDFGYHIIMRLPLDVDGQFPSYEQTIVAKMGNTMDALLGKWMADAKVEMTETFNEINYKNVYDYLPKDVAQILSAPTADAPTDAPSADAPTDVPSADAPTDAPSADAPTDVPSADAPTDVPSADAPTDAPSADAPAE